MSPEANNGLSREIQRDDLEAAKEEASAEYINNLIEADTEIIRDILLTEEEKSLSEADIARLLSMRVSEAVSQVESECNAVKPTRVGYKRHEASDPPVTSASRLGWIDYDLLSGPATNDPENTAFAYYRAVTMEGLAVVEGLEDARSIATPHDI